MSALKIAFDIMIVGALALPWVLLVIHLFFFEVERHLGQLLYWMKDRLEGFSALWPVAAVVLFAVAYTLGSAVTRVAEDFFNDDDLYLPVFGHIVRHPITEDRIVAHVYCDSGSRRLLPAAQGNTALAKAIEAFQAHESLCSLTLVWRPKGRDEDRACRECPKCQGKDDPACLNCPKCEDDFIKTATDIFGLQENALMDKGQDYDTRLRELHDQVMVLRGAAFNGLIAFSLCLFAWCGRLLSANPHSRLLRVLVRAPATFYLGMGLLAAFHHFKEGFPPDPPYMEFTLLLLGLLGFRLLGRDGAKEPGTIAFEKYWLRLAALFLVLMVATGLGWWSTKLLYVQQVIYSYNSQIADTPGAAKPRSTATTP